MRTIASTTSIHASVDFIPVVDRPLRCEGEEEEEEEKGEEDEETTKYPNEKWGARHSMVFLGTLGVILLVMMRNVISIAIVAMVDRTGNKSNLDNSSMNVEDTCPMQDQQDAHSLYIQQGEFLWDERTQGMVLGAYFYGNIMTNLVGGRFAEHVGGKLMFGLGIFSSALFTILSPFTVRLSTNLFLAVRLLTGAAQGFVMPALTRCLVTWIPPSERSKFNTIVFSGAEAGTVFSLAAGGWLCGTDLFGGWPSAFYVFGGLSILWCFLWYFLVTEKPECHPRISEEEKKYILSHCIVKRGKPVSMPWLAILTSVPLWSVFIMHIGHNWGYYTLLTLLPSYLSNIQHFELKSNGLLSALPYATKWIFALLYGFAMNTLIASGKLSTVSVRRISMIMGSFTPAIGLMILSLTGCSQGLSLTILVVSTTFSGAVFCGYFCSHQDLSPNLAGTLFGISNFLANTTGFIAPAVAGALLFNNQTLSAWNAVFYIAAIVYIVTSTTYAVFISTEVQPFNNPQSKTEKGNAENEKLTGPNKC